MAGLFHLAVGSYGAPHAPEKIQNALPLGSGWARYSVNCWFVKATGSSSKDLAERVKLVIGDDSVFVTEVVAHGGFGYLPQEIWDWINRHLI